MSYVKIAHKRQRIIKGGCRVWRNEWWDTFEMITVTLRLAWIFWLVRPPCTGRPKNERRKSSRGLDALTGFQPMTSSPSPVLVQKTFLTWLTAACRRTTLVLTLLTRSPAEVIVAELSAITDAQRGDLRRPSSPDHWAQAWTIADGILASRGVERDPTCLVSSYWLSSCGIAWSSSSYRTSSSSRQLDGRAGRPNRSYRRQTYHYQD